MRVLTALLVFLSMLAGCRGDSTDRFVGTWHRPKYPDQTITIKSEGDKKISLTSDSGTRIGHVEGDVAVFNAMLTATFKADGTLVYSSWEYVK